MAQFTVAGAPLGATIGGGTPAPMQFNSNFSTQPAANEAAVAMNPLNTSDRGLVQRQKDIIKLQDDMMLDISKGVDRLHDQVGYENDRSFAKGKVIYKFDNLGCYNRRGSEGTHANFGQIRHAGGSGYRRAQGRGQARRGDQ